MVSTLYRIFSDKAISDGYIKIGNIYDTASRNEFEHARILLKQLNNGYVPETEICPVCGFPQGYYKIHTNMGM